MKRRKFGLGRHTSIPEGLKDSIEDLANQECVDRIILGRFSPCRNKFQKGHLKYQMNVPAGIKVNGYTPGGVLQIVVTISPLDQRQRVINYINQMYP